jgi:hypothetical protein
LILISNQYGSTPKIAGKFNINMLRNPTETSYQEQAQTPHTTPPDGATNVRVPRGRAQDNLGGVAALTVRYGLDGDAESSRSHAARSAVSEQQFSL